MEVTTTATVTQRQQSRIQVINGEHLASLTTCNTNLNPSCDFHVNQKYQTYRAHWAFPAPPQCGRTGVVRPVQDRCDTVDVPPEPQPLYLDRLGANMQPICARFTS